MKTKYPGILGVFAALLMVASFVIPVNLAAPSPVSADPGIMKWDTVSTPNAVVGKNDILNPHLAAVAFPGPDVFADVARGSEIIAMAAGNDGMTDVFIARSWLSAATAGVLAANNPAQAAGWAIAANTYVNMFYYSNTLGIADTITRWFALVRHPNFPGGANLYQVAIAPDDPKVMVVTSDLGWPAFVGNPGPKLIWITVDAGQNWDLAYDGTGLEPGVMGVIPSETIRCIDVSIDYGGKRDIGFGTVNGTNGGRWVVRSSSGFTTWLAQLNGNGLAANPLAAVPVPTTSGVDYMALKFSPTYNGDSSVPALRQRHLFQRGVPRPEPEPHARIGLRLPRA